MSKFLKVSIIAVATTLVALMLYGLTKAGFGNYFINNPFNFILMIIGAIVAIWMVSKGIKALWSICLVCLLLSFQACNYAKSNQQVVVSDDCGMSWKKICYMQ